jgi:hypothetical protein
MVEISQTLFKKNICYTCQDCKGSGYMECIPMKCKICNGKKCFTCKESGYLKKPFETCSKCDGRGDFTF